MFPLAALRDVVHDDVALPAERFERLPDGGFRGASLEPALHERALAVGRVVERHHQRHDHRRRDERDLERLRQDERDRADADERRDEREGASRQGARAC